MRLKKLVNKGYGLFFAKEHPEPLAFFRILFGIILILTFLIDAPFIADYYSNDGFVSDGTAQDNYRYYRFSLLDYFSSPGEVYFFYVLLLASAFCLTIGYKTRFASIATFILLLSFHERNWLVLNSGDTTLRVMAFYLMLAPCGAAYSIDALKKGTYKIEKWYRFLIKFQTSIIYFFTGYLKLGGSLWWEGTASFYAFTNNIFNRFSMDWMLSFPLLIKLATWGAVGIDLIAPFLLWFKKTRLIGMGMIIATQIPIFLTMNIGTFQLIAIAIVFIFLEKEDVEKIVGWCVSLKNRFRFR